jgi:general secretion pathway protein I
MNPKPDKRSSGFTLIETLAALLVVAIAMAALWKGLLQGQYVSQELPDRILARWVAQNHLVTRQVMGEWPDARTYTGTESMAGREWFWEEQVSDTTVSNMRRVTVTVGRSEGSVLYQLEGYLHRTRPPLPYERIFSG